MGLFYFVVLSFLYLHMLGWDELPLYFLTFALVYYSTYYEIKLQLVLTLYLLGCVLFCSRSAYEITRIYILDVSKILLLTSEADSTLQNKNKMSV